MATYQAHPQGREEPAGARDGFTVEEVATMAIAARDQLTGMAGRHSAFAGLSVADIEELFDATAEMALGNPERYADVDHLRGALFHGMKYRASDLFRRRRRREVAFDDDHRIDLEEDDLDRIALSQDLLLVRDFLAALRLPEAETWKLVHGEGCSVAATAKHLGLSRHAVNEHLAAATRKLRTFTALAHAGVWCERREIDIARVADGVVQPDTVRRALAHLDACPACRRRHAGAVRRTTRAAGAVLPLPAAAAGVDSGWLERLVGLLPQGSGQGRTEILTGSLLGSSSATAAVLKAGAVVATTATVAVGSGAVGGPERREAAPTPAPRQQAARAPAPVSASRLTGTLPASVVASRTARRAAERTPRRRAVPARRKAAPAPAARTAPTDLLALGTGTAEAGDTTAPAAPSPGTAASAAPPSGTGESFLP
jgi:RNA polymerase sigma factor (sigma-70 family)